MKMKYERMIPPLLFALFLGSQYCEGKSVDADESIRTCSFICEGKTHNIASMARNVEIHKEFIEEQLVPMAHTLRKLKKDILKEVNRRSSVVENEIEILTKKLVEAQQNNANLQGMLDSMQSHLNQMHYQILEMNSSIQHLALACSDDLPVIPHAISETEGKGPPFNLGVEIPISCDVGYLTGDRQLKLKCVVVQGNAVWDYGDDERPCKLIICPLLPDPDHGRVISVGRHYGAVATYECDRGYSIKGRGHRVCGANSQWSGESHVCEVVTCLPPDDFQNGRVPYRRESYQSGDIIIFVCNNGDVRRTSKCSENGEWTESPPNCPGPVQATTKNS